MKKLLLALVLMVPMLAFVGCSSAENNARKEIEKRMNLTIVKVEEYTTVYAIKSEFLVLIVAIQMSHAITI